MTESGRSTSTLKQLQSLPLEAKIRMSQRRIREWYEYFEGEVYVSFSGGKDSTVLKHLVENTPGVCNVPDVFCDTGLEYPEVRKFARNNADLVIKPKMRFDEVIKKYGYPIISKEQAKYIREARNTKSEKLRKRRIEGVNGSYKISKKYLYLLDAPFEISEQCCDVMKKRPFKKYEKESGKKPYIGTMASESSVRANSWYRNGCNAFETNRPASHPMSFWTEQDVLYYIIKFNLKYASIYGEIKEDNKGSYYNTGKDRTGCQWCGFGAQLEKTPNRFQVLKNSHPKQYEYCMKPIEDGGLGLAQVLDYIGVPYE